MEGKDEYIVKIDDNGNRSYYKNGKLHRETGPAYIVYKDIDKFKDLSDEYLYKEVYIKTPKKEGKITTIYTDNGTIISYEAPIEYVYENENAYYLNGKYYLEQEFNAISLEQELPLHESKSKKIKI